MDEITQIFPVNVANIYEWWTIFWEKNRSRHVIGFPKDSLLITIINSHYRQWVGDGNNDDGNDIFVLNSGEVMLSSSDCS